MWQKELKLSEVAQSCLNLCNPKNYTVDEILQARILAVTVKSEREVAQSCPILSDPMDWSLPGSSIHGIFQARVLSGEPLPSPTNLDSILKSRDITLRTKVHLVKTMVFPVVMYGYEGWTIKKAEHERIDAFEL